MILVMEGECYFDCAKIPYKIRLTSILEPNKLEYNFILSLPGHALSGCDTVAACFGLGKEKMLKVLKKGHSSRLV